MYFLVRYINKKIADLLSLPQLLSKMAARPTWVRGRAGGLGLSVQVFILTPCLVLALGTQRLSLDPKAHPVEKPPQSSGAMAVVRVIPIGICCRKSTQKTSKSRTCHPQCYNLLGGLPGSSANLSISLQAPREYEVPSCFPTRLLRDPLGIKPSPSSVTLRGVERKPLPAYTFSTELVSSHPIPPSALSSTYPFLVQGTTGVKLDLPGIENTQFQYVGDFSLITIEIYLTQDPNIPGSVAFFLLLLLLNWALASKLIFFQSVTQACISI